MSGNWVMGNEKSDTMPSNTNRIEITVESTGRSMNFWNIRMEASPIPPKEGLKETMF